MDETNMMILLVEDNPKDVELNLHALKKQNLANEVHVARDGKEAIDFLLGPEAAARARQPKLVLLDLKLPKISGIEVLRRIKADARTKQIPVVVLTSSTEEKDVKECYALGVNSYLQKPVDFTAFMEVTHTLGLYWLLMNKVPTG